MSYTTLGWILFWLAIGALGGVGRYLWCWHRDHDAVRKPPHMRQ